MPLEASYVDGGVFLLFAPFFHWYIGCRSFLCKGVLLLGAAACPGRPPWGLSHFLRLFFPWVYRMSTAAPTHIGGLPGHVAVPNSDTPPAHPLSRAMAHPSGAPLRPHRRPPRACGGFQQQHPSGAPRKSRSRESRLDVHTELFGYVGTSRRTYRIVCLRGSPNRSSFPPPPPPPPPPTPAARLLEANLKTFVMIYFIII